MRTDEDKPVAILDELVVSVESSGRRGAAALAERLGAGDRSVALVGEAKRGKSTSGNALLGAVPGARRGSPTSLVRNVWTSETEHRGTVRNHQPKEED